MSGKNLTTRALDAHRETQEDRIERLSKKGRELVDNLNKRLDLWEVEATVRVCHSDYLARPLSVYVDEHLVEIDEEWGRIRKVGKCPHCGQNNVASRAIRGLRDFGKMITDFQPSYSHRKECPALNPPTPKTPTIEEGLEEIALAIRDLVEVGKGLKKEIHDIRTLLEHTSS